MGPALGGAAAGAGKRSLDHVAAPGGVLMVADDAVGLHATAAERPYSSLYARMTGPVLQERDDELYQRRNLVRHKVMRGTVFTG